MTLPLAKIKVPPAIGGLAFSGPQYTRRPLRTPCFSANAPLFSGSPPDFVDGESRSIGSSNIQAWQKRGMVGLVTSGGLADSDEIIAQQIPCCFRRLARGIRPGRNELESVNRAVTIGGVMVRPGDVVVTDGDGVVVVPRERAEEVAKAALPFLDNIARRRYIEKTGNNARQQNRPNN